MHIVFKKKKRKGKKAGAPGKTTSNARKNVSKYTTELFSDS